ncbi:PKD domain-containing protein [Streptomyces sp. NPDC090085]|uniref:PKD domain-containing protein n=1 Tax=Streptomyces sp. NPDC090085 TaxID=3365943 RepID=UPI00380A66A1
MRKRRLVIAATAIAAGVGLLPGVAQAQAVAADPHKAAVPDTDPAAAEAAGAEVFSSLEDRTTLTPGPAAKNRAASASAADALSIRLHGWGTSAHGVFLHSTFKGTENPLDVTIAWGDGTTEAFPAGTDRPLESRHSYAEVGEYTITVTATDPVSNTRATNTVTVRTKGSDFTPHAPLRLLDTRNGTGVAKGKVPANWYTSVKVTGQGTVPDNVTAVVLNLTVTNTTDSGHIIAWGSGRTKPDTSSVNYTAGQTVPNLVIMPVGSDGRVNLDNVGWGSVDLIADMTGYFTPAAANGYKALSPTRFVDTREGKGAAKGQVAGQGSFGVQVAGVGGVPKGATAVALNLTVTNPHEAGHLTVHPSGQATPTASNLNFTAGQTVANSVIVPIGPDGRIVVHNGSWKPADVVIDVNGYYTPDSNAAYVPNHPIPVRDLDTRESKPLAARDYLHRLNVPGVEAVVVNATVTNTTGSGHLSVAPDPNSPEQYENGTAVPPARPTSSNLNWTAGKTVANLVQARPGEGGAVAFWNQGWENIDLIIDYFGHYGTD